MARKVTNIDSDSDGLWQQFTQSLRYTEGKNYTKKYSSKYSWYELQMEIMSMVNNFWW